jgi:YHS domain-containing protein
MSKVVLYFDPICGMKIDPAVHTDSLHTIKYKEKNFYFCSPFCTATFSEDPERYASIDCEIIEENDEEETKD